MEIGFGSQDADTNLSQFQALDFFIDNKILEINTVKICQVTKVNDDGTLNVKSLVLSLDGKKEPIPSVEWKNYPILRQQGGTSGFVIQYNVGDIVLVGFCDRDPQAVVRSKKEAAPSTFAPFPLSGGIVFGAVLFNMPEVYVKTTDKVYCVGDLDVSKNVNIQKNLTVEKNCEIEGNLTVTGGVDATQYSVANTPGATLSFTDAGGNTHSVVNGIVVS